MPALIASFMGVLAVIAAPLVARVLLSLGVGVVSFIGMGVVLDFAIAHVMESFNGLPAKVLHMAALLKIDVAINILLGAVNARIGLLSLNGIVSRFSIDPAAYQ